MSQNYEMMYILRPDLTEEQVNESIAKYRDFITQYDAENIQIQNRGKRRLAYPIKKQLDGIYIQMNYQASGAQVAPLERAMRISDDVIRYLTIKLKSASIIETEAQDEAPPQPNIDQPATAQPQTSESPTEPESSEASETVQASSESEPETTEVATES